MILGVLNQKGGVGKTTVCLNLAAFYARAGVKVLVVDADPQASALAWSNARDAPPLFPVIGMATPLLHRKLPDIAADYDITLIDGAPRASVLGRAAILASDLVLIPVQPSPFDIWATDKTEELVREAQQFKASLHAVFAVNRKIVNSAIGRDIADALAGSPFPLLPTALCQRVIYAESAAQGLSVIEADENSEAAREIALLGSAVLADTERLAA
jgi:chromosome partitioning protein